MSGNASNNKWKEYGGTKQRERFQNMEVGIITADKFITRNQNSLFTFFDSLRINGDADIMQNLRVFDGNSYFKNKVFFGTTDISNSAVYSFLKGNSQNSRYEFSHIDTSGNGGNTMLSVNGNMTNTNIVTFQTTAPRIRNIITRQGANSGSVFYADTSASLLGLYSSNDISYISFDTSLANAVCHIGLDGGKTIIDTSYQLEISSTDRIAIRSKSTIISKDIFATTPVPAPATTNSLVTIIDISDGPLLYDAYLSQNISLGKALSLQSVDNSSSTSMRFIDPSGDGIIITGGSLPTDTSRGMGMIGTIDISNIFIPNQVLVSGTDPRQIRNTLGINTYSPKTEHYTMDINGPIHLGHGELNTLFYTPEISNNNIIKNAKNNRDFIINTGVMDSSNTNIYISNDGAKSWRTINLNTSIDSTASQSIDCYIDSSSTFFIYTTYNNSILYTINGGNSFAKIIDASYSNGNIYKALYYDNSFNRIYVALKNNLDQYFYQYCSVNISTGNDISGVSFQTIDTSNQILVDISGCDGYGSSVYFYGNGLQKIDISGGTPNVNIVYKNNTINIRYNSVYVYGGGNNTMVAVGNSIISVNKNNDWTNGWYNILPNILGLPSFSLYGVYIFDTSNVMAVGLNNSNNGIMVYTQDLYNSSSVWKRVSNELLNSSGVVSSGILNSKLNGVCMTNINSFVMCDSNYKRVLYGYYPNILNGANNIVMDVSGVVNIDGIVNCNNFISQTVVITDINVQGNTFFKNMIVENIASIGRPFFLEYRFDLDTVTFINQYGNTTTEPVGGYIIEFPINLVDGSYIDQFLSQKFFFALDVSGGINVSDYIYKDGKRLAYWSSVDFSSNDIYWDDGDVGIGLQNPIATLDVSGTTLLRGDVSMNRNLDVSGTTLLRGDVTILLTDGVSNINMDNFYFRRQEYAFVSHITNNLTGASFQWLFDNSASMILNKDVLYITTDTDIATTKSLTTGKIQSTNNVNEGITIKSNVVDDTSGVLFLSQSLSSTAYNPIVQDKDAGIFYNDTLSSGSNSTKGLIIAPFKTTSSGLRMDGSGNSFFYGKTLFSSDISMNGNLDVSGAITGTTIRATNGLISIKPSSNISTLDMSGFFIRKEADGGVTFDMSANSAYYWYINNRTFGSRMTLTDTIIYINTNINNGLNTLTTGQIFMNSDVSNSVLTFHNNSYINIQTNDYVFMNTRNGNYYWYVNNGAGGYKLSLNSSQLLVNVSMDVSGAITSSSPITGTTITANNGSMTINQSGGISTLNMSGFYIRKEANSNVNFIMSADNTYKWFSRDPSFQLMTLDGGQLALNVQLTLNSGCLISGDVSMNSNLVITGNCTATTFNATSDYRIKTNIKDINGIFTIENLRPVQYLNKLSNKNEIGFIAHEVQEHFPELVNGLKDNIDKEGKPLYQSINYIGIIPLLVEELKNMKKKMNEHNEDIQNILYIMKGMFILSILSILSLLSIFYTFLHLKRSIVT